MSHQSPPPIAAATDALERAAELEPSDWSGAIELLCEANRRNRSDAIELELAALRHRSARRLDGSAHIASPAAGAAPPIGDHGLPEVSIAELDAATLRAAIVADGSLLVRNALALEHVREVTAMIDRTFEARDAYGPLAGRSKHRSRTSWWDPLPLDAHAAAGLGRTWVRDGGGALLGDSPRAMFEILELYSGLGLHSVASEYLGERPVLSANKCTLRRVPLDATGGWHQDGAFLGDNIRALNLWLCLTPCGVDAPGLDLVPRRLDSIIETGTGGAYFDWAVGADVVTEIVGERGTLRPQFDAGDLLLFDEMYLHSTAVEPTMTRPRHAIEMWCFTASAYPAGHVALVW